MAISKHFDILGIPMETRTSKILMFWLVVTCIAASIVPFGSAQEGTQDLLECLSSFTSVEGCIEAIDKAVSDKTFGDLGPACCEAITLLGDHCWPIVFPHQPFVPCLLKTVCKLVGNVEKVAAAPY
ncbi:Prolamin-like domain - like 10 [Theobroma cacao]|nr:Prolamin-like domain - like 10 [Theobroma cacao]